MFRKIAVITLALAVATPALAQNRFMNEAKENAARRDENKAVREAEHPADPAPTQTAAAPAAPAAPAAAAQAAPAPAASAPATPASPAAPAAPVAPATAQ